ncbi:MAG: hemerythrin domain-containing protein [Polyangiaceae bacterium]|nr:hemerythrin domain-containing protein [Polyangiaceae bacterium]
MNAIDLLKEDHTLVRDLLEQLTATSSRAKKSRADLLVKIAREIRVHAQIEEDIFYPAFRKVAKDDAMFFEALEEHRAVERLVLPDLEKTPVDSERFSGRAKVLKDLIEHHADEEEEEMFPKAKKLMAREDLEMLGKRMLALKSELKAA